MESFKVRKPAVAGQFYPSSAQGIKKQITSFVDSKAQKNNAIACILPHAGYAYSGNVAVKTVSAINLRQKIILLGPNHTGFGEPFSIMTEGSWQTPLGETRIEQGLAKKILSGSQYLKDDALAHLYEHSLEVELPILQYFRSEIEIVPIVLSSGEVDKLKKIGEGIASAILEYGSKEKTLIVASSDMTHYEPQSAAESKDKQAISAILELNEELLAEKISSLKISMCGYAPVITMLSAAKLLGAKSAKLIKYETSGEVTGEKNSVVGYAGIIIN